MGAKLATRHVLLALAAVVALGAAPPATAAGTAGSEAAAPAAARPPAAGAPMPAQAQATTVTGRIHDYNVCNNVCGPTAAQNAMNVAAWMFRADGGWTLSLQELCSSRFADIVGRLGVQGSFVASRQDVAGCPEDHLGRRWFGNAVLHLGTAQDVGSWFLPIQREGLDCANPTTECRTMVCVKAPSAAGDIGPCTSHFDNRSDTVATSQANEFLYISVAWQGSGRWRWLTGDFNLTPAQIPGGYADWRSVIDGPTFPSSLPTETIDYIWLDPHPAVQPRSSAAYCAPEASDHCWARGEAVWTP